MDYVIDGGSSGVSKLISSLLVFTPKTPDISKSLFLRECSGSPGVRIRIVDNSRINIVDVPISVAGIVGFSSKGAFNKILRISNVNQLDSLLGGGFNNPAFNQGLYAARAILNNGGFVEYVRPYGEEVDLNSQTERELKSDAYVFTYDYNPTSKNNPTMNFFAATRHQDDGYSSFGKREIFTAQKAILQGKNFDFSLNKQAVNTPTKNEISLFSIINEDPTTTIRATGDLDKNGDRVIVSFASYKLSREVTDSIQMTSQPSDGDVFSTIDENGLERFFEFDSNSSVSGQNIQIEIGSSVSETLDNTKVALVGNMPNHSFTKTFDKIVASVNFGIKDQYNQSTQNKIFTEIIDTASVYSVGAPTVVENAYLLDTSLGRKFLELGLADEKFVRDVFGGELVRRYLLNEDGLEIAKFYLMVDYSFGGLLYSFSGTIVPKSHNDINLYIKSAADSVSNGFQFLINSHANLVTATTDSNFNLGQMKSVVKVRVATIEDIALSGFPTIDGVTLIADDKVLVKEQSNPSKNGIYVVSSGNWERSIEANESAELNSDLFILVEAGITYSNTTWKLATQNSETVLETTPLFFFMDSNQPIISLVSQKSFDEEDPSNSNNSIWSYTPRNQLSTDTLVSAWELFLNKANSNADFLMASGTCIKNLFSKNAEELNYVVIESMLNICDKRKDMFALFDGVDELNISNALVKMIGVGSFGDKGRWGAIFDGRSIFNDKQYTKLEVPAVKSIEVGAIITNNRRGGLYWISPAGKDFGTIPFSLASRQKYLRKFNTAEDITSDISKLYEAHINPTRIINSSAVIYGQKTMLKRDTDLNRLNVTMLVAGLHKKLKNFLDNKMLKLNSYSLRLSVREELTNMLNKIKSATPAGLVSFDVICDDNNNTKETISQNKLIVDISLNPAKTSECIILRTTIQRTGNALNLANFELKIR